MGSLQVHQPRSAAVFAHVAAAIYSYKAEAVAAPAQDVSVARRTGPSSTWLARVAKLSEDSVSEVELASGDTQHMSSTFADPHSESCNTCA